MNTYYLSFLPHTPTKMLGKISQYSILEKMLYHVLHSLLKTRSAARVLEFPKSNPNPQRCYSTHSTHFFFSYKISLLLFNWRRFFCIKTIFFQVIKFSVNATTTCPLPSNPSVLTSSPKYLCIVTEDKNFSYS